MIRANPGIMPGVRANRAFLARVVRYLVSEAGVTQFLDLGTGLPSANNVHEVAQSIDPAARVVYVDNDPIVLVHARALLTGTPGTVAYIDADIRDVDAILDKAGDTLDLTRPVAVMLLMTLQFIPDEDDPFGLVRRFMDAVPSGSHLVISSPEAEDGARGEQAEQGTARYNQMVATPMTRRPGPRSRASSRGSTSWSRATSTCRAGGRTRTASCRSGTRPPSPWSAASPEFLKAPAGRSTAARDAPAPGAEPVGTVGHPLGKLCHRHPRHAVELRRVRPRLGREPGGVDGADLVLHRAVGHHRAVPEVRQHESHLADRAPELVAGPARHGIRNVLAGGRMAAEGVRPDAGPRALALGRRVRSVRPSSSSTQHEKARWSGVFRRWTSLLSAVPHGVPSSASRTTNSRLAPDLHRTTVTAERGGRRFTAVSGRGCIWAGGRGSNAAARRRSGASPP